MLNYSCLANQWYLSINRERYPTRDKVLLFLLEMLKIWGIVWDATWIDEIISRYLLFLKNKNDNEIWLIWKDISSELSSTQLNFSNKDLSMNDIDSAWC